MATKAKSIFILVLCISQILSEMDYGAESLKIHEKFKGKLAVKSRVSIQDKEDLSVALLLVSLNLAKKFTIM